MGLKFLANFVAPTKRTKCNIVRENHFYTKIIHSIVSADGIIWCECAKLCVSSKLNCIYETKINKQNQNSNIQNQHFRVHSPVYRVPRNFPCLARCFE